MKIAISGGHLTPALAVIEALQRKYPDTQIIFIGREYAQEKEQMRTKEREEVEQRGVQFFAIDAAKVHRTYFLRNFNEMLKFGPSISSVRKIFKQEKPDLFLSFGGYLAVPIAMVSKFMKIPVITHEQTRTAGLANMFIAKIADVVAVTYEQTRGEFPKEKVVVTGNPLRPAFKHHTLKKPAWLNIKSSLPLIYVTGGSQGSHVINQNLARILPELVKKAVVVHQCGASNISTYLREMEVAKEALERGDRKNYIVHEWVTEEEVAWLFQHAQLIVARSGANTVLEVAACKVPALFIPLPFSHGNEQLKNAQALVQSGSAVVLQQKDLTAQTFLETILKTLRRYTTMKHNAERHSKQVILNADERLAELAHTLLAKKG